MSNDVACQVKQGSTRLKNDEHDTWNQRPIKMCHMYMWHIPTKEIPPFRLNKIGWRKSFFTMTRPSYNYKYGSHNSEKASKILIRSKKECMDQMLLISLQAISSSIQVHSYQEHKIQDQAQSPWIQIRFKIKSIKFTSQDKIQILKSIKTIFKIKLKHSWFTFEKVNHRIPRDCNTQIIKSNKIIIVIFSCLNYYFLDLNFIVYKF